MRFRVAAWTSGLVLPTAGLFILRRQEYSPSLDVVFLESDPSSAAEQVLDVWKTMSATTSSWRD